MGDAACIIGVIVFSFSVRYTLKRSIGFKLWTL